MLLADLHDQPHLLEVVAVGTDFLHQAVRQGSQALDGGVLVLVKVCNLRDRSFQSDASLAHLHRRVFLDGEPSLHFMERLLLPVLLFQGRDYLGKPHFLPVLISSGSTSLIPGGNFRD